MAAVACGNVPALRALLNAGADLHQPNQHGTTPEELAKICGTHIVLRRAVAEASPPTGIQRHLLSQGDEQQAAGEAPVPMQSSAEVTKHLHAQGASSAPLAFGVAP